VERIVATGGLPHSAPDLMQDFADMMQRCGAERKELIAPSTPALSNLSACPEPVLANRKRFQSPMTVNHLKKGLGFQTGLILLLHARMHTGRSRFTRRRKAPPLARPSSVRKTPCVSRNCVLKTDHFTKTGSGQTREKLTKGLAFPVGGLASGEFSTISEAVEAMTTPAESGVVVEPRVGAAAVRQTHIFWAPLYPENDDHFTKTGSGQTQGKALKKRERDAVFEKQACDATYERYGELAEVALKDRDACRGIGGI
jgi:hypothetical protein